MSSPYALLRLVAVPILAWMALTTAGCRRKGAQAFNKGQSHLAAGRFSQAADSFTRAVREAPDFGEAHYNLGAAYYGMALKQLEGVVRKHGSRALKAILSAGKGSGAAPAALTPDRESRLGALRRELARLPAAQVQPVVALVRAGMDAKLKARALFLKGKFSVIRKASARHAVLAKLAQVVRLKAALGARAGGDHVLWLVALTHPELLLPAAKGTLRPKGPEGDKRR